jgi:hypothetical protein
VVYLASCDTLYIEEMGVLFTRASTGFFEPIAYECKKVNGEIQGKEILKGSFLYDFIMFIRFSERKQKTSGKKFGEYKDGFLEIFQWIFALKTLSVSERLMAEKLIGVFSRQS